MSGAGFIQFGRRHWAWRGQVPGDLDRVRDALVEAIRLMSPSKLEVSAGSMIRARIGGVIPVAWAATEEISAVMRPAPLAGTELDLQSRSLQLSFGDSGRNRANLVTLLNVLGIHAS
jgi:hypothetical protein